MRYTHYIFVFFLLVPTFTIGQIELVFDFKVLNVEGDAIIDAYIKIGEEVYPTDEEGVFSKKISASLPIEIYVRHVGYESKKIKINRKEDLYFKEVLLQEKTFKEFVLTDEPDTVYGDKTIEVQDFGLLDDYILLLTHTRKKREGTVLILIDENSKEVTRYHSPLYFEEIYTSFDSKLYVNVNSNSFEIELVSNTISLTKVESENFKELKYYHEKLNNDILWSNYQKEFPAFEYYAYQNLLMKSKQLYAVKDSFQMDMFRAQYKYLEFRDRLNCLQKEKEIGVDKEIIAGYLSGYSNSIYYRELYTPLFVINDSTRVFDHSLNQIVTFDQFHTYINETRITYHLNKKLGKWKKQLLRDNWKEDIYAVFAKDNFTFLVSINYINGEAEEKFKLKNQFVEKIKIRKGWAYYIYRPYNSYQKKFLYRERVK